MDKEKLILVLESLANRNIEAGCANRFLFNDEAKAINEAVALLKEYELYIQHQKDGYAELEAEYNKLLKEQEAKMVQSIRTVAYRTLGYCPSCGRGLDSYHDGNSGEHITHFCYNCGQAVKWD